VDFVRFLAYQQGLKLMKDLTKFHTDWEMKAPHNILDAYLNEAYAMINEFLAFKDRLAHSLQLAVTNTESIHFQLTQRCHSFEETVKFLETSH